jgi:hypothetical protein
MSAMEFREPNEVLWRGVRPAHKGTQVLDHDTATNETTIIHTVGSGATLFLVEAMLLCVSNVTGYATLFIRDDGDALVRYLCTMKMGANGVWLSDHFNAWPPVELPEDYDICVLSSAAGLVAQGSIFGWEE